jgi:hypothetical protein
MNPGGSHAVDQVSLAHDGKAAAYLVLDASSDTLTSPAIEDLASSIERMSGAKLPNQKADGLIPLYVGEANQFTGLPFPAPKLENEEFLLRVTPQAVYLLGGSPKGTSHAVYTLLRDLGCRWIMPGDIGECIPSNPNLSIAVQDRVEGPDFGYRIVWYAYGCSPEAAQRYNTWLRRNRMGKPGIHHGHNLTNTLARKAPYAKRPDLYSVKDGKRVEVQICTSNPEVVKLVTESIKEYLDAHPEVESYSLCPDDNADFCECDKCKALDVGHMDRGGEPSISDRYQIFLNQVFEGLKDSHPNVMLTTYSYNQNHTDPPQKTWVNPKTCIFVTTSAFCAAHGIGDSCCASRQDFKTLLSEWTPHTKNLIIYEYDPIPYSGALPWPMWRSHIREMPIYKELGIQGLSFEGQDSWAAYFPNYYIGGQMMWDSSQDGEALFQDMLRSFYEEAAPAMSDYYKALESHIGSYPEKVKWGLIQYPDLFPPEVVQTAESALQEALAVPVSPIVKERLEMARLSFEEMKHYLAVRDPKGSKSFEEYQSHVVGMRGSIDQLAAKNEDFILHKIAHQYTGNAVGENFGPEMGFLNRWLLCGPFDNPGMQSHDAVLPPEKEINPAARYEGKGGVQIGWKPNRTPAWKAYVDLRDEFEEKDYVCAYALCWITVKEGPKKAELRLGSNDSIKAFLNGHEILNNKVERVASVDADVVTITLPQGTSALLLKVCQTGLNWGLYCRLMEPGQERKLEGITISTVPPK